MDIDRNGGFVLHTGRASGSVEFPLSTQSGCLTSGTKRQIFTTSTVIFSENRFPVFADADLRFVLMAYSSHSVMKLPFSWMSVVSSGPGPRLVNLWGVFGGTIRIWPADASICWSPTVNSPVPARMMKISQ